MPTPLQGLHHTYMRPTACSSHVFIPLNRHFLTSCSVRPAYLALLIRYVPVSDLDIAVTIPT